MSISDVLAPLASADHRHILRLFRTMRRQHLHLDWHSLEDWLDSPYLRCWVARRGRSLSALMGATLDFKLGSAPNDLHVCWLRLAIPAAQSGYDPLLGELWDRLRADLRGYEAQRMAVLVVEPWIESYLAHWRFEQANEVITLRREGGPVPLPPADLPIPRPATAADLDEIARLDAAAFEPLWRYQRAVLEVAAGESATFTVIEMDGRIVGYQLSTRYSGTGHLARLAVLPEMQGRGIGQALVCSMLEFFRRHGITIVSVNTQADNFSSQRLYQRLGFFPTGHKVPVWVVPL